jgi:flagellar M-ring protein FliF
VAAAVAGLSADRVAIVDDRGNLLAGGDDKSGPDALARSQDEDTTNYENSLRQRVEAIVSSVVGAGRVQVQVAADINYNHTQTTEEKFDPDSKVVRSTQTVEQNASNTSGSNANAVSVANALPGGAQPAAAPGDQSKDTSGRTEETTNYEISKTVKTSTVDGGDIKKVSVAVVVDGSGDTVASYKPRSPEEMSKITALVKSAMGFDAARGDLVQVTNMQFARIEDASGTPAPKPLLGLDSAYWFKIIEAGIMCLTALLIGLFVARPLINRMFAAQVAAAGGGTVALANSSPVAGSLPAPAAAGGASPAADGAAAALPAPNAAIDISRIDGQVRESSIKKVGEVVTAHPEEALAIIRTWLHQPV